MALAAPARGQDAAAAPQAPPPLSKHELLKKYVWTTLGPTGMLDATVWSAFDQWRDSPRAWSSDGRGYAERWGSEFAASAIGSTSKYAVARLLHQDPSFVPCECVGVRPRLAHALLAPFMARTSDGVWVFSPATVTGYVAENVIPAATWYPAPRGVRDGALHALSGVAAKAAVDVVKEFMPERFRKKK